MVLAAGVAAGESWFDAVQSGKLPAVRAQLAAGAEIDARNKEGWTALHVAAKAGHAPVVKELLGAKASVSAAGPKGYLALHVAAEAGHRGVVELLLRAGAAVDAVNLLGESATDVAQVGGHAAVVEVLARRGGRSARQLLATEYKRLGSEKAAVRGGAARAIAALGPSIVAVLVRDIEAAPPDLRDGIARVVGLVGPGAGPALRNALASKDAATRAFAAETLAALGEVTPDLAIALAEQVRKDDSIAAARALARAAWRDPKLLKGSKKARAAYEEAALVLVGRKDEASLARGLYLTAALGTAIKSKDLRRAVATLARPLKKRVPRNATTPYTQHFYARYAVQAGRRGVPGSPFGRAARAKRGPRGVLAPAAAGLVWLVGNQEADGRWKAAPSDANYDLGVTALCCLALLGHPVDNPLSERDNPHATALRRGLDFLIKNQWESGEFHLRERKWSTYSHFLPIAALAEAYALSGEATYLVPVERGVKLLEEWRNPYLAWRYKKKGGENDTSLTFWAVYALRLAWFGGVLHSGPAIEGARQWADKMTDPNFGNVGYNYPGGAPMRPAGMEDKWPPEHSESMTAAGVLLRCFAGEDGRKSRMVKLGIRLIVEKPPLWNTESGRIDIYYWHLGALALAQAGAGPGRKWFESLATAAVAGQEGNGSWPAVGIWGKYGGRAYATASMVLALQAPYRYGVQ